MTSTHPRVLHLERMTHAAFASLDPSRTFILAPVSPIEVHGPHLPLGQDLMEAVVLAEKAAEKLADQRPEWTFVLLPPLPVAADGVPMAGSIRFPADLVREVAYRWLKPFAEQGFARLAFSNFHGGPRHVCALEQAAKDVTTRHGTPTVSLFSVVLSRIVEGDVFFEGVKNVPGRRITREQLRQDHHAGYVETSIGLAMWPELVEQADLGTLPDRVFAVSGEKPASEAGQGKTNESFLFGYAEKGSLRQRAKRVQAFVESILNAVGHLKRFSYCGLPALASAEEGRALVEHLTEICEEVMEEFIDHGTDMPAHSPLWKYRRLFLNPLLNRAADKWA